MKIISSQQFRDWDIVDAKIEELETSKPESVTVPCWYIGEINGESYAVQYDAHHTATAAQQLGIKVEYDITDDPDLAAWTPEQLLEMHWMDGDWYDVETSDATEDRFDLVDFAA